MSDAVSQDALPPFPDGAVLPVHVAIIMDGNGRWAQRQGKSRHEGHEKGVLSVKAAIELCNDLSIPNLTLFAFQ